MASSVNFRNAALNFNDKLERLIPFTTVFAVALGFFFPNVFIHLRPFVTLLFAVMTFSGALKLKAHEMGNALKKPSVLLLFFAAAHIIMPVIAILTSGLFFKDINIITGFVLLFACPTAVSGFIWILIYKGDKALALTLILLDTLMAPFIVPATLHILLGKTVIMNMSGIAFSLILMVVVPTIIGVCINEASRGKAVQIISPYLDPFSKLCLILVIAANASPVVPKIQFSNPLVWQTAALCIPMIILGFIIMYAVSVLFKLKSGSGISILVAGGLRNNSAAMTIAVSFFSETVALPVIISLITQQSIMAIAGYAFGKLKIEKGEDDR